MPPITACIGGWNGRTLIMIVADIMTRTPVTIRADHSLAQALELMQHTGCRHLPVISRHGHVIGILSDRDCRSALNSPHVHNENWNNEELSKHLMVRVAMTPAPITTEPDLPASEAARLMLNNHVGCLPVMRAETLVGIVTTSDILMAFINLQKPEFRVSDPK
ncbi:MAG TPA: CBS domain-containing protein [Phototrophicaceae bacterium]|jgi:acetoin utilization protein AcuB|nr:CBS domain-containing protein [Phototrophicaceae bacterium]